MLKWYICKNNDLVWEGCDDGDLRYRVYYVSAVGWCWEDVPEWEGEDGYETAEAAMAAAEKDYEAHDFDIDWEDLDIDWEDLEDIHWDEVAHERMEIAKGLF